MQNTDLPIGVGGTAFDYSKSTKQLSLDRKWLVLSACLLIFILDIASLIYLLAAGYEFSVAVYPMLFALGDAIFAVVATRISFQFRYAKWHLVVYFVVVTILLMATIGVFTTATAVVMTDAAVSVMTIFHIAVCLLLLLTVIAAKGRSKLHTTCGIVVLSLMLFISFVATGICFTDGFFGQATLSAFEEKTVVYAYDIKTDSYTAKGYLTSKGTKAVIPATFNDKPVLTVDTALFDAEDLTDITFEGEKVTFVHTDATLSAAPEHLVVHAGKAVMEGYRRALINLAYEHEKTALFGVADAMTPTDLAEGEHMVIFTYPHAFLDATAHSQYQLQYLTTLDTMTNEALANMGAGFAYYKENPTEADLLQHRELGNLGYYISAIQKEDGSDFVGSALSTPVTRVSVSFDKFLRVMFEESNDDFSPDTLYPIRPTTSYGGRDDYHRYTFDPAALLDEIRGENDTVRPGFSYTFDITALSEGATLYTGKSLSHTTAREQLAQLQKHSDTKKTDVLVTVNWSINIPTLQTTPVTMTYGDTGTVLATVSDGDYLPLTYRLERADGTVVFDYGDTPMFSLPAGMLKPTDENAYRIIAKINGAGHTALGDTTVTCDTTITVQKKVLNAFAWQLNGNNAATAEYTAEAHLVTFTHDDTEQILGDQLNIALSPDFTAPIHVGTYTATLILTGSSADYYTLGADSTFRVTITPKVISVGGWDNTSFVYNGQAQAPKAIILDGLCTADDPAEILGTLKYTYNGAAVSPTNAGNYLVAVTLPQDTDYVFATTPSVTYTIAKAIVSADTWTSAMFIYNGQAQAPHIATLTGLAPTDTLDSVLKQVSYTGAMTHVGTDYTVTATLTEHPNYTFASPVTTTFSIAPKSIAVGAWNQTVFTYTGTPQAPKVTVLDGVEAKDAATTLASLLYSEGNVDVGTYSVTVTLPQGADYMFAATQEVQYTIQPALRTLVWTTGTDIAPPQLNLTGADYRDDIAVTYTYYLVGEDTPLDDAPTGAGEYRVVANITFTSAHENFTFENNETTYTILPKEVTP